MPIVVGGMVRSDQARLAGDGDAVADQGGRVDEVDEVDEVAEDAQGAQGAEGAQAAEGPQDAREADAAGVASNGLPPQTAEPRVGEADAPSTLLAWLAGDEGSASATPPPVSASASQPLRPTEALRDAARALARSGDPIRLAARVGSLDARVRWFRRWLALLPEADGARWLARRWGQAPRVAPVTQQASEAEERLERLLQEASLSAEQRLLVQAVWLAATTPEPICFDAEQRSHHAALRDASLLQWVARCAAQP